MIAGRFESQTQAFLPIQPMDPMLADLESFSPKQDVNPAVAVSNTALCKISNPLTKEDRVLTTRSVSTTGPRQRQHSTSSPLADLEAVLEGNDEGAPLGSLQSFFSITYCSIALSSDRSATIDFSFQFSSSRSRSLRSSDGPRPPNFRFQR